MRRDFTNDGLTELCKYLPTDNDSFLDSIGDLGLAASGYYNILDIVGDMENINSYHKEIMDRYNTTKSELTTIFDNVRELDDNYKLKLSESREIVNAFKDSVDKMVEIMSYKPGTNQTLLINIAMQSFKTSSNTIGLKLGQDILNSCTDASKLTESEKMKLETYLDIVLNKKSNVTLLGEDDKNNFIKAYELLHEECKSMDTFLVKLKEKGYDDDIREIKLLTYTAEEPYRTVFLDNVDKMKILDLDYDYTKPQCYSYGDGGIHFCQSKWNGDYTTFFHECGHNIDDLLAEGDGEFYTMTYDEDGSTLMTTSRQDVVNCVEKKVECIFPNLINKEGMTPDEIKAATDAAKTEIVNSIMNCPDRSNYSPVFSSLEINACYRVVVDSIKKSPTSTSQAFSDVYGGFSGNLLKNNMGHDAVSLSADGTLTTYWINSSYDSVNKSIIPAYENGNISYSGKQAKELWAENYAAEMTNNKKEMSEINSHFAEANEMIGNMMDEQYEKCKQN